MYHNVYLMVGPGIRPEAAFISVVGHYTRAEARAFRIRNDPTLLGIGIATPR